MRRPTLFILVMLVVLLIAGGQCAFAQTATPPPATPTFTPTRTPPPTYANPSTQVKGQPVTDDRIGDIINFAPGAQRGDLAEILKLGVRQIKRQGTNATALGLTDVGTVTSILAFTTSTGAGATKTLLVEPDDYTVANGDITPVGDHSAQTWLITYRPYRR